MGVRMEKPAIAGGTPVRATKLYYGHQFVDKADVKAVEEVLTSDYLTCGPKVVELEKSSVRSREQNMRSLSATALQRSTSRRWRQAWARGTS